MEQIHRIFQAAEKQIPRSKNARLPQMRALQSGSSPAQEKRQTHRALSAVQQDIFRENLKKAFIVQGNDVKCKIIMLIDDIYTTGATMDACSEALLAAGAAAVYFVVFAIGESGPC